MVIKMNAYQQLGVEDLINRESNNIEDQTVNGIIKVKTKRQLDEGIKSLNQILKENLGTAEKLTRIKEKLSELIKQVVAYDYVATAETRADYDKKGKPDVEQLVEKIKQTLKKAVTLETNGKAVNAYQILGIANNEETVKSQHKSSNEKTLDSDKESGKVKDNKAILTPEQQDRHIEARTYENIGLALSVSNLRNVEEIESFMLTLSKYLWAYSKISSTEKRKEYKYEELAKKGDKAAKSLGEAKVGALRNQQFYPIDLADNSQYERIDITKAAVLQSCAFGIAEQHAYGYKVDKYKADGSVRYDQVFSNIDINRMKEDVIYRQNVLEKLLSDESIRLGQEKLGRYVGELDENGNVKFDLETIGTSRSWERRRKAQMRKGQKDAIQEDDNKPHPTDSNPDPDDRR